MRVQRELAEANNAAGLWAFPERGGAGLAIGGCFLAFARGQAGPGAPGDRGWAAAVTWARSFPQGPSFRPEMPVPPRRSGALLAGTGRDGPRRAADVISQAVAAGEAGSAYRPGLLALREGPLLEAAVRGLDCWPEVLLVDATGHDHPRRAGLAVHLGAVLGVASIGVTHRPLLASGPPPRAGRGQVAPLRLDGEVVGYWVCTRSSARPVVAHAGWRTTAVAAAEVVLACSSEGARTPVPLGEARRVARESRAIAEGRWRP